VREVDVAVVGAGIVGAACAHALTGRGLSVAVLEQAGSHSEGSTGRSFACVRVQWTDPLNVWLSWTGIRAYRSFPERLGADVGYRPIGYLLLVPEAAWEAHLAAVEVQRSLGAPVDVVALSDVEELTPCVTEGLGGATLGTADGVIDPVRATAAYLDLARRAGATVSYRSRLEEVRRRPDGSWVLSTDRDDLAARWVVNAAGGWGGEVAALAGIEVPVVHSRRSVFATAEVPMRLPMTVDVGTGCYLRSEGERVIFGASPRRAPEGYDVTVDWPWMEEVLAMAVPRFPWLGDLPLDRRAAWAGTYEQTPDDLPVLGPVPWEPTWVNACGFSGHGVMQAHAAGLLVAEAVAEGAVTSVDVSPLSIERFVPSADHQRQRLVF